MKHVVGLVAIVLALSACQTTNGSAVSTNGDTAKPAQSAPGGAVVPANLATQVTEPQKITFFNSEIFENDFGHLLKTNPSVVTIEFPKQFSLNEIPPHLEPWLAAVQHSGGKVSTVAVKTSTTMASRALIMDLLEFAWDVVKKLTQEDIYSYASKYNAIIKYAQETGYVITVEFTRRPG